MAITGNDLIAWGFKPSKWFGEAIRIANEEAAAGVPEPHIIGILEELEPKAPPLDPALQLRTNTIPFGMFLEIDAEQDSQAEEDQRNNINGVIRHMDALMRTPTIVAGAVMPDACPSGSDEGTIPVGGVVATKDAIHPGFHSADICCSMAITVFKRDMDVGKVLDLAMKITHFGGRARECVDLFDDQVERFATMMERFSANRFMSGLEMTARNQIMTQGDGNHFFYVGHLRSTGELAIVTHHGSRNVGGQLYKRGMAVAQRHTSIVSPRTPPHNAWIDAGSDDGRAYWEALQLAREWTRFNHFAIHDAMQQAMGNKIVGRLWNEHNFVFRKADGLFYHAKGATPGFAGFSRDDVGRTLVPLNMGQPILIADHGTPISGQPKEAMQFLPHGAGRNLSRTAHMRRLQEEFSSDARGLSDRDKAAIIERETSGIDVRFYCGNPDLSELPSAYKDPNVVRAQMTKYGLARIVDEVLPSGSLMAGDLSPFWRKRRRGGH